MTPRSIERVRPLVALTALSMLAGTGNVHAQDPAQVNAGTIRVKLENDRIRVLEAVLRPGDKEQMHSHPAYVVYVISGGTIRSHGVDDKTTEASFETGDVLYREPLTHWAENIGTTPIHLILVELKGDPD